LEVYFLEICEVNFVSSEIVVGVKLFHVEFRRPEYDQLMYFITIKKSTETNYEIFELEVNNQSTGSKRSIKHLYQRGTIGEDLINQIVNLQELRLRFMLH
jgi:hypothetical protein